ncbi:DMT family transporter [Caproiciproducens sp.]|uniref:DMT family transporter n=1 Tax=Caproiciproducens sp. TaxID=1954376 RepID=UPI00289DB7B7|nr:DMT family transporter [Caproiciproducens sp.]
MLFFAILATVNGIINIINKMINLQAKLRLGMANGTLINYMEASVISVLLIAFTGSTKLADLSYLTEIPFLYFGGGIFGLFSMIFILRGMAATKIIYSTVIVLIGQLGTGFLIDTMIARQISPLKILGILLVITGVLLDKSLSNRPGQQKAEL